MLSRTFKLAKVAVPVGKQFAVQAARPMSSQVSISRFLLGI